MDSARSRPIDRPQGRRDGLLVVDEALILGRPSSPDNNNNNNNDNNNDNNDDNNNNNDDSNNIGRPSFPGKLRTGTCAGLRVGRRNRDLEL